MKQTLTTILFTLITNSVFGCLSATQNRIFPLGNTPKGFCVVETHFYRTEFLEPGKPIIEMKPAWGGISYFKIYDKNYKAVYSETIDTIKLFEELHYDSIINKTYKKGLQLAEKYPNFVAVKPISIAFCDYKEKCTKAKLIVDTTHNKISIQLPNSVKKEIRFLFDSTSIASNLIDYFGGFDDAELSTKSFEGKLFINSVRQFQIGNKKLSIVHIGSGLSYDIEEALPSKQKKEFNPKLQFPTIDQIVFIEHVLHHGHGFDFYFWE